MGFREWQARLKAPLAQLDALRLQERYLGLGLTPIDAGQPRVPLRIAGEVQRLGTMPATGVTTLAVHVSDGTGTAIAVFTGRRRIGGIEHGRGLLLEGVAHLDKGRLVLLNPLYTLLPG